MKKLSAKTLKERYAGRMEQTAGARALSDDELDAVAGGRNFTAAEIQDWFSITGYLVPEGMTSETLGSYMSEWDSYIDALAEGTLSEPFSVWMAKKHPEVIVCFD